MAGEGKEGGIEAQAESAGGWVSSRARVRTTTDSWQSTEPSSAAPRRDVPAPPGPMAKCIRQQGSPCVKFMKASGRYRRAG